MLRPVSERCNQRAPGRRAVVLWQIVALCCVIGLTLPDAWRALHLMLVPHVACPYDGVMVHADELPAATDGAPRTAQSSPTLIPRHDHRGCAALDCSHHPSAMPAVSGATLRSTLTVSVVRKLPPRRTSFSRAVLSYAPKLPPPASFCA